MDRNGNFTGYRQPARSLIQLTYPAQMANRLGNADLFGYPWLYSVSSRKVHTLLIIHVIIMYQAISTLIRQALLVSSCCNSTHISSIGDPR